MTLPVATIALSIAASGLKIYGGHGELLEFIQHPLDLLAGHSGAKSLAELGDRLSKWVSGNDSPDNEDLERAITRSALLADLFCLSEGLPRALGGAKRFAVPLEQFRALLGAPMQGLFSHADGLTIRAAMEGVLKRLRALETGAFVPIGIDAPRLFWSSPDDSGARDLATRALEAVEREYQPMPDVVQSTFRSRWFGYLCLAFHEEIKTNDRVYRIFSLMQTATGFVDLEHVIREEGHLTRREGQVQHADTFKRLDEIRGLLQTDRGALPGAIEASDSLAVLPFTNLSGDPDFAYFSDGIADGLINSLSQLSRLRVVPRSLAFRHRGCEIDPRAVAQQLNARAILTGRVLLQRDIIVIGCELLDAATVSQIWGAQYHRSLVDIFAVQEEITREIADKLRFQLTRQEKQRLSKRATQSSEAYQLYLKAIFLWNLSGWAKAVQYAQQAIEKDPAYAPAYSVLAISYVLLGLFASMSPSEAFPRAKAAAFKALSLDEISQAHTALALARLFYDWDWVSAEKECKSALESDPNDPLAYYAYSCYFLTLGRFDESEREARRGLELDPTSMANHVMMIIGSLYAQKFDQAIDCCRIGLEIDPHEIISLESLALSYVYREEYDKAFDVCETIMSLAGPPFFGKVMLGYCQAVAGRLDIASAIAEEIERIPGIDTFVLGRFAGLCVAVGKLDRAFEILNRLCDERCGLHVLLNVYPMFFPLHVDPRFDRLLRRIGLPQ